MKRFMVYPEWLTAAVVTNFGPGHDVKLPI